MPTIKMKLLNINAAAKLKDPSNEALPETSEVFSVLMGHSKSKMILVNGLADALKGLFNSPNHLRMNVDTKMGFVIGECCVGIAGERCLNSNVVADAECVLDKKLNPLNVGETHAKAHRIAIMVQDFHDTCQGDDNQVNGITALSYRLLRESGYDVLPMPYNEFNTSEKILKRVQYLQEKFNKIVKG